MSGERFATRGQASAAPLKPGRPPRTRSGFAKLPSRGTVPPEDLHLTNNVTDQLLLEHLKAVQAKVAAMNGRMNELQADVRGIRSHMAGFMRSEVSHGSTIAAMQAHLDRIERRLELHDRAGCMPLVAWHAAG